MNHAPLHPLILISILPAGCTLDGAPRAPVETAATSEPTAPTVFPLPSADNVDPPPALPDGLLRTELILDNFEQSQHLYVYYKVPSADKQPIKSCSGR